MWQTILIAELVSIPKTRLQEYLQARQLDIPHYTLISQDGLPHEQTFKVECSISLFDKKLVGELHYVLV
jgi:ribonuclease-3